MPKAFTYFIAGLIVFLAVKNIFMQQETTAPDQVVENKEKCINVQNDANFIEKSLANVLVNTLKTPEGRSFVENLIQPITNATNNHNHSIFDPKDIITHLFKIDTLGDSNLGTAYCGQKVVCEYTVKDIDNNVIEHKVDTITLGDNQAILAIENIVIGMHLHQTRIATTPPSFAYDNFPTNNPDLKPGRNYNLQVKLYKLENGEQYLAQDKIKNFDNIFSYEHPMLCGQEVTFSAKIYDIYGKIIWNEENLTHRLGSANLPVIFNHSLSGKPPSSTRTTIAPAKYLKNINNKKPDLFKKIKMPENELVFIEFYNTQKTKPPVIK